MWYSQTFIKIAIKNIFIYTKLMGLIMKYTDASKNVFLNTGTHFPKRMIWSIAAIKYSAAKVNFSKNLLSKEISESILIAAKEVMDGKFDNDVIVDVFQTGSGTGINMNINEIIANRASEIARIKVHPNDHINMGQSSNDVVPTAVRISAVIEAIENVIPSIEMLINSLNQISSRTSNVYKSGRTHLRDALPVTMGQEFSAYADAFNHNLQNLRYILDYVKELPIGGTAVGTGLNADKDFGDEIVKEISSLTKIGFKVSNRFRALRLLSDLVTFSGILRTIALDLYRLSQDIRLMFSGPITALGEIDIPTQEEVAGSSIMPGKTNPITVESTLLACAQVIGIDHSNQIAGMLGEFELSMGVPLMGYNILTQEMLISEAMKKMSKVVIDNIVPDKDRCIRYAESSPSLITVISPIIGYDKASIIGKKLVKGLSIREALKEEGFTEDKINEILDMTNLVKPGIPAKNKKNL